MKRVEHKHHINVLYGVVVILLILQVVSFLSTSSQTSKILNEQEIIRKEFQNNLEDIRKENQNNIGEIVNIISEQKKDFENEIEILKITKEDFSTIIESSLKRVVSISTESSAGTGFAILDGTYIVTNQHVIVGASFVNVLTFDDRVLSAQIIGFDSSADIALLKIGESLESFEFLDSDEIVVGEKVIAIGNPLGLSFTVTEGIVSAVNREGPNGLGAYIQTDVPLNRGNSGGPLINKAGKVIGVNNFKVGEAEALGFALEGDVVQQVIDDLLNAIEV